MKVELVEEAVEKPSQRELVWNQSSAGVSWAVVGRVMMLVSR